ncbi:MAG TPA: hypothetical protein VGL12_01785, partial [Roseiarcus sp.]
MKIYAKKSGAAPLAIMAIFGGLLVTAASAQKTTPAQEQKSIEESQAAKEKRALKLVQTISLPGVVGRLDHMGVDLEQKRLFVAAVDNNTLEVVDLTAGNVIKSLQGFRDTQDALFLGGDFNKLFVSSLDG